MVCLYLYIYKNWTICIHYISFVIFQENKNKKGNNISKCHIINDK